MATRTPIRTPQQAFSAYVTRHPDLAQAYAKSGSKTWVHGVHNIGINMVVRTNVD